jgi:uncharacterized protein (UPF0212 family)
MTDKQKLEAIREVINELKGEDVDYVTVEAGLESIEQILNDDE